MNVQQTVEIWVMAILGIHTAIYIHFVQWPLPATIWSWKLLRSLAFLANPDSFVYCDLMTSKRDKAPQNISRRGSCSLPTRPLKIRIILPLRDRAFSLRVQVWCQQTLPVVKRRSAFAPPDHQFLDRSPNIGPLISRSELGKFKNCWNIIFRTSKILTLLYQRFSNLLISQRDMSGPRLGSLSNNGWSGGSLWARCLEAQE
jgi:hypothetical protein